MTEKEMYRQVRREAAWTGLALAALILFWLAAGFGTAGWDVRVCHLPLWAVVGTVGVWGVAILLSFVLSRHVFRDMPLEPPANGGAAGRTASGADAGAGAAQEGGMRRE